MGHVVAVSRSATHTFSKQPCEAIHLLAGLGVEGDAHLGETVRHRSRVAADPTQPNYRQVHLIHAELQAELRLAGFEITPGQLGENITTLGIDVLSLPVRTILRLGSNAVIQVTGLRNPCSQLDHFQPGLMAAVLDKTAEGKLIRKSGIMGVVLQSGSVKTGDSIVVELPPEPHQALDRI